MRQRVAQTGPKGISVHAIAGTYVVVLGFDAKPAARKGLLGFALHRTDQTEKQQFWLKGFRTFAATDPHPKPGTLVSTQEHPIQGFQWGDYTAKPNRTYIYKVVPVYGTPKNLVYGPAVSVTVKTEGEKTGEHEIYFNRGVAGSQAYAREFGNRAPDEVGPRAFKWLSRGLEEALLEFIGRANGPRYALRAAVYEFSYAPVLQAFKAAAKSGADVKIVYDARKADPRTASDAAIAKAGIRNLMIPRTKNPSYIAHNKFIVLLRDGKPIQVLTGSTNFTEGGIFGQSNVVHILNNPDVAARYLEYWQELSGDPDATALRPWTVARTPEPAEMLAPGVHPIFSPRATDGVLEWYSRRIDGESQVAGFTAAFGVNALFAVVLQQNQKNVRYVLLESIKAGDADYAKYRKVRNNFISIGAVLKDDAVGDGELRRWVAEKLTALNTHVKYLHTKYLFIDPLGDAPTVITGSANFSTASTTKNDENMLLVQGNTAVADVYLGEFMRLWNHFFFRDIANRYARVNAAVESDGNGAAANAAGGGGNFSPYLNEDDSWTDSYFGGDFRKTSERTMFA